MSDNANQNLLYFLSFFLCTANISIRFSWSMFLSLDTIEFKLTKKEVPEQQHQQYLHLLHETAQSVCELRVLKKYYRRKSSIEITCCISFELWLQAATKFHSTKMEYEPE